MLIITFHVLEGLRDLLMRLRRALVWAILYIFKVVRDLFSGCVANIRILDLEANIPTASPYKIELGIVHGLRHRLAAWGVLASRSPELSLRQHMDELERRAEDEEEDAISDWDAWGEELV